MATAAAILESGLWDQKVSEGIQEAALAVGFAQNMRLYRLGFRLSKLNAVLNDFFEYIYSKADGAQAQLGMKEISEEQLQVAMQMLMTLYLLLEEIYRRSAARKLTNCSRFGISQKLAQVHSYRDRLWGLADWLEMIIDPSECERRMKKGRDEFDRGEFSRFA